VSRCLCLGDLVCGVEMLASDTVTCIQGGTYAKQIAKFELPIRLRPSFWMTR
jgi:hypothetical protein